MNKTAKTSEDRTGHFRVLGGRSTKAGVEKKPKSFNFISGMVVTVALVLIACFALYPVGQNYYKSYRAGQRIQAEYQAVSDRNSTIQDEITYLNTDTGVEDSARSQFGYVMPGENAVSVTDAGSTSNMTTLPTQIKSGSVRAPDTWYTKILDKVFQVG